MLGHLERIIVFQGNGMMLLVFGEYSADVMMTQLRLMNDLQIQKQCTSRRRAF